MTVKKIEFSGRYLAGLNKALLISCLNAAPQLVANYQIFPQAMQLAALEPALVVETADLTEKQQRILAFVIWLASDSLVFETPS